MFHNFTACDSPFDLSLIIKPVSAKHFESVTGAFAIKELTDLYPEFKIHAAMFDKAYDAIGFYRLLTSYLIALDKTYPPSTIQKTGFLPAIASHPS